LFNFVRRMAGEWRLPPTVQPAHSRSKGEVIGFRTGGPLILRRAGQAISRLRARVLQRQDGSWLLKSCHNTGRRMPLHVEEYRPAT